MKEFTYSILHLVIFLYHRIQELRTSFYAHAVHTSIFLFSCIFPWTINQII